VTQSTPGISDGGKNQKHKLLHEMILPYRCLPSEPPLSLGTHSLLPPLQTTLAMKRQGQRGPDKATRKKYKTRKRKAKQDGVQALAMADFLKNGGAPRAAAPVGDEMEVTEAETHDAVPGAPNDLGQPTPPEVEEVLPAVVPPRAEFDHEPEVALLANIYDDCEDGEHSADDVGADEPGFAKSVMGGYLKAIRDQLQRELGAEKAFQWLTPYLRTHNFLIRSKQSPLYRWA
jgi:hypothetical protein